jgi:hypothetical protein
MLFDQAAPRRSQVCIGTQTTRSIEDEDDDENEDDCKAPALLALSSYRFQTRLAGFDLFDDLRV